MVNNFFLISIITLFIIEIGNPLEINAEHKNNLINKFCIASLKSKLKFKDKKKIDEISHFTCECFSENYSVGSSINKSRVYCQNKAIEKFNL